MKKCPDCRKEYDDSAKFCLECGGKLEPVVIKLTCPQCGTEYKEGAKFCMECGFKLIGIDSKKSSSVSLGDGNAISGGVDASSNSHNTTTVNKSNVVNENHTTANTNTNTNTTTSNSNNTTTNVFNIQGGLSGAIGGFNLGGGKPLDAPEMYEVTFNANSPCIIFDRFQEVARIVDGDEYGRYYVSLPMKKGMHRFEFVCIEDKKIKKELIKAIKSDEDTIIDIELDLPMALPTPEAPIHLEAPTVNAEIETEVYSQQETSIPSDNNDFDDTETTTRPNEEQTKSIPLVGEFVNGEFTAAYSKSGNKIFGFVETSSLEEYAIINGTEVICDEAFKDTLLETIYLPASIKLVSKTAFDNCDNLKNIIVPEGMLQDFKSIIDRKCGFMLKCGEAPEPESDIHVTFTEDSDFNHVFIYFQQGTPQLVLSSSCQRLLNLHPAFNLKELVLPPFVMVLCDGTFNRCDCIERVVLPPTIENIGQGVFEFCPNLKEIVVPSGMMDRFRGMVDPSVAPLLKEDDVYTDVVAEIAPDPLIPADFQLGEHINGEYVADYSNDGKQLIAVNENAKWLNEYHVLDGTEVICHRAFKYCAVETVFLPRSLKIVGEKIFEYCINLKEICIPKGQASRFVEMLPDYTDLMVEVPMLPQRPNTNPAQEEEEKGHFMYDPNNEVVYSSDLTRVLGHQNVKLDWLTLLNSTKVICNGAFEDSIATTIEIPESVEVVGKNAFDSPSINCICSSTNNENHLRALLKGSKYGRFINKFDYEIDETQEPDTVEDANESNGVCYQFNENSITFYNSEGDKFLGLSDGYDLSELSIMEGAIEFGDTAIFPEDSEHWDNVKTIILPKSIQRYNWPKPLRTYFPNLTEIRIPKGKKTVMSKVFPLQDLDIMCVPGEKKAQAKSTDAKKQEKTDSNVNDDVLRYAVVKNGRVFQGLNGKYRGTTLYLSPDTIDIKVPSNWSPDDYFEDGAEITTIVLPDSLKKMSSPEIFESFINLKTIKVPEGQFKKFAKLIPSEWHMFDDGMIQRPWEDPNLSAVELSSIWYGTGTITGDCKNWFGRYFIVPETVHTIEKNALEGSSFETIYFCNGVKVIKNGAFKNCKSLTTIYLPKSLTDIETGGIFAAPPFSGCQRLKKIVVPKGTKAKFKALLNPLKLSNLIVEEKR